MIYDSNIIIYAAAPEREGLRQLIRASNAAVSAISRVEVLGYHALAPDEERGLTVIFEALHVLPVSTLVIEKAIDLRQQRRMSLGDAIVAATALLHDQELATHNTRDFDWIDGLHVIDPMA